MTGHVLYCRSCGAIEAGHPDAAITDDQVAAFARRHPEVDGHRPELITYDQAHAIIAKRDRIRLHQDEGHPTR
jgi:hypothetical protein